MALPTPPAENDQHGQNDQNDQNGQNGQNGQNNNDVVVIKNENVRLLAYLMDEDNTDDSNYRVLVDGKHVKYVTTGPGTFEKALDERYFEPILLHDLFPQFPDGDWNNGRVERLIGTPTDAFVETERIPLPAVDHLWHPVILNELDFTQLEEENQRVHVAKHPDLNNGNPVVVKYAVWPWEVEFLEMETFIYQLIDGSGIGPKFLGHILEGNGNEGRVIGFALEFLEDGKESGPDDFAACQTALAKLHALGILHGDLHAGNFLVRETGGAVLIDFEGSECGAAVEELEAEAKRLRLSIRVNKNHPEWSY